MADIDNSVPLPRSQDEGAIIKQDEAMKDVMEELKDKLSTDSHIATDHGSGARSFPAYDTEFEPPDLPN